MLWYFEMLPVELVLIKTKTYSPLGGFLELHNSKPQMLENICLCAASMDAVHPKDPFSWGPSGSPPERASWTKPE